jgi:hypothetical protein
MFGLAVSLVAGTATGLALGPAAGLVAGAGRSLYTLQFGVITWLETPTPIGQARTSAVRGHRALRAYS